MSRGTWLAATGAVLALMLVSCEGDEEGGPLMRPGERCLSCHSGGLYFSP